MPSRTAAQRLAFALFVVVAFFLLLEGGLWAVGLLGRVVARSRSPAGDPDGAPVLVCLGDSVTFGLGADTDRAYPAVLGAALPGQQVVNLGRPGFNTERVAGVLEGWLAEPGSRGPTRALLLAGFNDCAHLPGLLVAGEGTARPARELLRRSRTYRLLTQLVRHLRPSPEASWQPTATPVEAPDPAGDLGRCAGAMGGGLDRVQALCDGAGIELILVTYPVPARFVSDPARITTQVDALIAREAAVRGLPLLDVRPCMRGREAAGSPAFYNTDGIHMSAEGYAALAECVTAALAGDGV